MFLVDFRVWVSIDSMGPVRGSKKKRKRDFSENEESGDWWVDFSKGINGILLLLLNFVYCPVLFFITCFVAGYMIFLLNSCI